MNWWIRRGLSLSCKIDNAACFSFSFGWAVGSEESPRHVAYAKRRRKWHVPLLGATMAVINKENNWIYVLANWLSRLTTTSLTRASSESPWWSQEQNRQPFFGQLPRSEEAASRDAIVEVVVRYSGEYL
jgi:hypothetical protein